MTSSNESENILDLMTPMSPDPINFFELKTPETPDLNDNFGTFPELMVSDEEIDICGSTVRCCYCNEEFYIPNFFYPHLEQYEMKIDNGAFEHNFGYACLTCQNIPNILDIVAAMNNLCFLSDWTIKIADAKMDYEYDRISRVAEWNADYGGWCLNWYTIPNSSTKPHVGDFFLHLFGSFDVEPYTFLKRQPKEVLEALREVGVPYKKLPYRKMKVHRRL